MNWLDWMIIVIVVLSAWNGLRRGLILSLAKTAGLLIGLIVAFTYYRQLADYIAEHWRLEDLTAPLSIPLITHWRPVADLMTMMPDDRLVQQINVLIANNIIICASFLILLMITASIIGAAGWLITKMVELSLLGPVNRVGGLLFGFLTGLLFVTALLSLMAPFQQLNLSLAETGNSLWSVFPPGEAFAGSVLLKYFQPFLDLLTIKAPLNMPPMDIHPEFFKDISV